MYEEATVLTQLLEEAPMILESSEVLVIMKHARRYLAASTWRRLRWMDEMCGSFGWIFFKIWSESNQTLLGVSLQREQRSGRSAIWAAQLWPPQKLCASSGQRTTWTTWRSTRGKVALKAQNLRRGFKVNKEYKGSHSYGTISQEEMEEAARIRSRYDEDFASVKKAEAKKSKARKRLLLKRLRPSFQDMVAFFVPFVSLLLLLSPARADQTDPSPMVIRLQRVPGNGTHFYVGRLSVGSPKQTFSVLFDTASGHVLLPHSSCMSKACQKHKQFFPYKSKTSLDVNSNGLPVQPEHKLALGKVKRDAVSLDFAQADLGEGSAKAVLVKDRVCIGSEVAPLCTEVDVMAAVEMQHRLFEEMPYDGLVGLGMGGLSAEAGSDFFSRLVASNPTLVPQLGMSLGAQSGELYVGHQEASRMSKELTWFPVLHPEDGFWEDSFEVLRSALATATPLVGGGCQGEDLLFDLGEMTLKLRVEDYAAGPSCAPQLGSLDLDPKEGFAGVYAFGEAMLRQYYTALDWTQRRIGFAPAAPRRVPLSRARDTAQIFA
eukprot:g22964.t1